MRFPLGRKRSDKLELKMRWKWLLLLSLISISLVVATDGDDAAEQVETVNGEEDNYDDEKTDESVVEETHTDDDPPPDADPSEEPAKSEPEEEPKDEDTVDVENVQIGKQAGKYMNYDDFMGSQAFDNSDSSYNWNGECPGPALIGTFIIIAINKKSSATFLEVRF